MAANSGVLPARLRGMQKRLIFFLLLLILLPTVLLQFGGLDLGFDVTPLASGAIILLVLAGFWALLKDQLQLAIGLVNACFFIAAAVSVLLGGLVNVTVGTALFFVPVALAGMFQDRWRMLVTVSGTVLVVSVGALLQNADLLGSAANPGRSLVWLAAGELILAIVLVALVLDLFGRSTRQALDDALIREQELTALIEVDAALTQGLRSADTMQVLLRQVTERLAVDAATVLHFDRDSETLTWQSGTGFRTNALERTQLKLGEGFSGRAASERRPIYVFHQAELEQGYRRWPLIADEGIHFYVAVPLVANDELEGVLELFHRSPLNPDSAWKEFLAALATQAALVFSTARILQTLAITNQELRQAYDTTIEGWSRALDLRDHETEGHSRRVTELTVELARRLGASEDRLVHIRRGALLHDIGKMGVPDSILLKPGKLTDQERQVMQRHTSYAFQLLSPVEFLKPALDIPYSHHENWDGSGYPQGLKGEEIPLAARAFSVVDVFDALTNDRPYQEAWGKEQALEYIAGQADKKFDPRVVARFLEMTADRDN